MNSILPIALFLCIPAWFVSYYNDDRFWTVILFICSVVDAFLLGVELGIE